MYGLGRGLSALIPQIGDQKSGSSSDVSNNVIPNGLLEISPNEIFVNSKQPRREFAEESMEELEASIREHGILQPLIVTKTQAGYELIAGERRLRIAKKIGLSKVPVILKEGDAAERFVIALIENVQREDLNPIERALAYKRLVEDFQLPYEEVEVQVGKKKSSIINTMRLLKLPRVIQHSISQGEITEGHAKVLAGLDSENDQVAAWKRIRTHNLSVADIEERLRQERQRPTVRRSALVVDPNIRARERQLEQTIGTRVRIKKRGEAGRVEISFFSEEEFESLLLKLSQL